MNAYAQRLNAWHLELSILADAIGYLLTNLDGESDGVCATAHVLGSRLAAAVESCPFPHDAAQVPDDLDFDPDDLADNLPGHVRDLIDLPHSKGARHD
jgi:hypothetical protein